MSESEEQNFESMRNPSELPHHWRLRKEFLKTHNGNFDQDRLISLSHLFVNIKCLGLTYPQEVMEKVDQLAKSIDTKIIEEASIGESYDNISCDEPQKQHQPFSRHNNNGGHSHNNQQDNNQRRQNSDSTWRNTNQHHDSRPYDRPRFQQNHQIIRHQPYQQQHQRYNNNNSNSNNHSHYQQQQPQPRQQQQQQQQPQQQHARYSEQPRFFRPQELRPRPDRQQGFGHRQPFHNPRQRGNHRGASSDGPSWR